MLLIKGLVFHVLFLNMLAEYSFSDDSFERMAKYAPISEWYLENAERNFEYSFLGQQEIKIDVRRGDTLNLLLQKQGIPHYEIGQISNAMAYFMAPTALKVGTQITLRLTSDFERPGKKRLFYLTLPIDEEKYIEISRQKRDEDTFFFSQLIEKKLEKKLLYQSDIIASSLFNSAHALGLNLDAFYTLVQGLDYLVDFQRDIREGTPFEVIHESFYRPNGTFSHHGKILYASLGVRGETIRVYWFSPTASMPPQYFTEEGISAMKAFLKNPVRAGRISSHFGNRKHPILNFEKKHQGIDFAAPRGTPVYAIGDGYVEFAGRKGGYGNYVVIRHNQRHSSAYAHLHKFGKGIRKGVRVKQKDIIGHVGATGMATGDHLHFEIIERGRKINPLSVKSPPQIKLEGDQKTSFESFKNSLQTIKRQSQFQAVNGLRDEQKIVF